MIASIKNANNLTALKALVCQDPQKFGTAQGLLVTQLYRKSDFSKYVGSYGEGEGFGDGYLIPALIISPENFGYVRDSKEHFLELAKKGVVLHPTG